MAQKDVWEMEYKNPQLITLGDDPRKDLKVFLKFLRRKQGVTLENLRVLDLGSGTGRNANYLAGLGSDVIGLEISKTAVELARHRAQEEGLNVDYRVFDIGQPYPFEDEYFDLVLDVMSSNSLDEKGRAVYLEEVHRVLKQGGYFFLRGLCKDGDKNAKNLLKLSPGLEYDTYLNKDMGLVERVFGEQDFIDMYSKNFDIIQLDKKTNYAKFNNRSYKRNYWLACMKK
jgi:SAM-dependent methyltransferase